MSRIDKKTNTNPYQVAIDLLQARGVNISLAALKQRVSRANRMQNKPVVQEVNVGVSPSTAVSTLTPTTATPPTDVPNVAPPNYLAPTSVTASDIQADINQTATDSATASKAGCPKGTTNAKKAEDKAKLTRCIEMISIMYHSERQNVKAETGGKGRVKKGFLNELIDEQKKEHGVIEFISPDTIRTRVDRGRLTVKHRGTVSPVEELENYLVSVAIQQMCKINQPLSCGEALALANCFIDGKPMQERLAEFQMRRKLGKEEGFQYGTLTQGWWYGFLKRNAFRIVTKRGEKFACMRSNWTTYENIAQMYDVIYDEMVDAGVAVYLEVKIFTDREGNVVDEEFAYGFAQDIKITHPDYILFADEVGCNTSQKDDGNVGGKKMLCEPKNRPRETANSCHE
ncbi:hypothetical protein ACHAWO_007202 [Cyclotella atomus]|uniref:Uncharacterized protein n=1 Tax=Cyclotella atomus TaxID=382360 RepID=A0ABD3ND31_9STRA